jgi:hypothetical protein
LVPDGLRSTEAGGRSRLSAGWRINSERGEGLFLEVLVARSVEIVLQSLEVFSLLCSGWRLLELFDDDFGRASLGFRRAKQPSTDAASHVVFLDLSKPAGTWHDVIEEVVVEPIIEQVVVVIDIGNQVVHILAV